MPCLLLKPVSCKTTKTTKHTRKHIFALTEFYHTIWKTAVGQNQTQMLTSVNGYLLQPACTHAVVLELALSNVVLQQLYHRTDSVLQWLETLSFSGHQMYT